jgi:hypothetical protein
MKILVITNQEGKVIGTARMTQSDDPYAPSGGRPVSDEGHRIHEVTLAPELHDNCSAQELHRELGKLIEKPS